MKQNRTRLSLCLTVNATGTERLPPLFIGKFCKPRCFKKKTASEHGYHHFDNKAARMTMEISAAWLRSWNFALQQQGRYILLLLDNFSGHKVDSTKLSNMRLEFFTANLTAHIQPCDAGVIRTFKAYFRRLTVMRRIDKTMVGDVPHDLFAIDQLDAMHLAKEA